MKCLLPCGGDWLGPCAGGVGGGGLVDCGGLCCWLLGVGLGGWAVLGCACLWDDAGEVGAWVLDSSASVGTCWLLRLAISALLPTMGKTCLVYCHYKIIQAYKDVYHYS